jgi:hypothetical protein
MKTLLIYIGLFISFKSAIGQSSIIGCYGRQDSQIKLNADSTFFFFHAVDTYRGWLKGTWTLKRKKIVLTPKLVYDTITSKNGDLTVDSLILSRDYTSDRMFQTNNRVRYLFQYEQSEKLCPKLLKYKGDVLYAIKNKKLQKKKINNGYYIEPFNPWYTKNQCKY